ncbi:hypothetical protein [uncultured Dysosmobacter sp.]|uniref:hypothetical protein n=1 Tax=uncultured Dysosmobacter sp. TaxID=2591384 RepID=UPI002671ECD0|nr:hypothetical protein [uncultured Dysosmobacter sp.]
MNREEAITLGVPEERLGEFLEKCNRDINRAAKRRQEGSSAALRTAIESMLPVISSTTALREILSVVTRLYCMPGSSERKEGE